MVIDMKYLKDSTIIMALVLIFFTFIMCFCCGKYTLLKIASGSMQPTLNINDYVIVKESSSYNVGDIITLDTGGCLVTHRLVNIQGESYITKGDYNNSSDDFVITKSDIIGKVVLVIRDKVANIFKYFIFSMVICILFFDIRRRILINGK